MAKNPQSPIGRATRSPQGTEASSLDRAALNRRSTLEWKLDQGTAWRQGSLDPTTGLTPWPEGEEHSSVQPNPAATAASEKAVGSSEKTPDPSSLRARPANDDTDSEPNSNGDTAPLPKRETRLVWRNGMDVSDEFRRYAERVEAGEDLPPFQGSFLADPTQIHPLSQGSLEDTGAFDALYRLESGKKSKRRGPCPNPAKFSAGGLLAVLGLTTAAAAGVGFVLWSTVSEARHPFATANWLSTDSSEVARSLPSTHKAVDRIAAEPNPTVGKASEEVIPDDVATAELTTLGLGLRAQSPPVPAAEKPAVGLVASPATLDSSSEAIVELPKPAPPPPPLAKARPESKQPTKPLVKTSPSPAPVVALRLSPPPKAMQSAPPSAKTPETLEAALRAAVGKAQTAKRVDPAPVKTPADEVNSEELLLKAAPF